jgi:Spy/CpxP family protein refolding chaperone
MARHIGWALAAVLLAPTAGLARASACGPVPQLQQPGHPGERDGRGDRSQAPPQKKWWLDPQDRADLGITNPQSAAIDQIWQKSMPKLIETGEQVDKLDKALSEMFMAGADERIVIAQIDKVETARAEGRRVRDLMLFRMYTQLTPDQRAKVKAMHERRDPSHRGSTLSW